MKSDPIWAFGSAPASSLHEEETFVGGAVGGGQDKKTRALFMTDRYIDTFIGAFTNSLNMQSTRKFLALTTTTVLKSIDR